MAVTSSASDSKTKVASLEGKKSRSKCPGVRVIGGRIYDSDNVPAKTRDFAASCKNLKGDKPCPINYCHKCLINRYGEKAEDVAVLDDWKCPKCRDICNCSFCMKKRGQKPTGILVRAAKENGFSSVSELLQVKGPENFSYDRGVSSKHPTSEETMMVSPRKLGKENSFDRKIDASSHPQNLTPISVETKSKRKRREGLQELNNGHMNRDCSSGKGSQKKPRFTDKVSKSKMKIKQKSKKNNRNEVNKEEMKSMIHSEDASTGEIVMNATTECCDYAGKEKLKKQMSQGDVLSITSNKDAEKQKTGGASTGLKNHLETKNGKAGKQKNGGASTGLKSHLEMKNGKTEKQKNGEASTGLKNHLEMKNGRAEKQKNGGASTGLKNHLATMNGKAEKQKNGGALTGLKNHLATMNGKPEKQKNGGASTGLKNHLEMKNEKATAEKQKNGGASTVLKNHLEMKNEKATKSFKSNTCLIDLQSKQIDNDIPLPLAACLTTVAGIELPNELAGDALQFFEFCAAFNEALDLKKGQPEAVIREIIFGRGGRRSQGSSSVQFHIKLLSLILENMGEMSSTLSASNGKTSWLKSLGGCVSNRNFLSAEFPSDCFDRGNERYDMLDASQKFKLLNFLCDEALNTKDLRSWIDDQHSKFLEREKEAKEKVLAAKDKEKLLKQKVQDEVAKAIMSKNGASLSISEHEEIVLQIRKEAARAHAEMLEAMGMVPKRRQRSDAVRTDPVLLDVNGRVFWRLKGYKNESDILLQDMGIWDSVVPEEKWFVYGGEKRDRIEKYISSLRTKRLRVQKTGETHFFGDKETTS